MSGLFTDRAPISAKPSIFQWAFRAHRRFPISGFRIPLRSPAAPTLNNVATTAAGTYSITVTNQFGIASASALLTVITPAPGTYEAAVINLQPEVYLGFSDIDSTNCVVNEGTLGSVADATAEGNYVATTGPLPPSFPNFESTDPAVQFDGATTDVAIPPLNFSTNTGNMITLKAWLVSNPNKSVARSPRPEKKSVALLAGLAGEKDFMQIKQ